MKKVKLLLTCLLAVLTMALYAQNRQISGTVTDPDGNPMPGVAVFVEGTNVGTVTDAKGAYTLNMRGGNVVKFSFFGMRDVIVPVENQSRIDVAMEEDTIGLDEVVITATGMTRQEKTLGYASTTVRSEEILQRATPLTLSPVFPVRSRVCRFLLLVVPVLPRRLSSVVIPPSPTTLRCM
jgi:hypothetical protein